MQTTSQRLIATDAAETEAQIDAAIKEILDAESGPAAMRLIEERISSAWLRNQDELRGNIYNAYAFGLFSVGSVHSWSEGVRMIGFIFIFLAQLLGPPGIFFQTMSGKGLDEGKIDWSKLTADSLFSDWTQEYSLTKFMAFVFLVIFYANGLFMHSQETLRKKQINKLVCFFVDKGDRLGEGLRMWSLKYGSLLNMWVIVWLFADVFILLGQSESIQDVIMDALGLVFLYNLDDIGADLRLSDLPWPSAKIGFFLSRVSEESATEEEYAETEASHSLWVSNMVAALLFAEAILGSILFIVLPFKVIFPDDFYKGIQDAEWLEKFVKGVINRTEL